MKSARFIITIMAVVTVVGGCLMVAALAVLPDGPLYGIVENLLSEEQPAVFRVFIQAPPVSVLGEDIKLVVTVQNIGSEYVQIDEIRLPDQLLQAAVVKSIFPGTLNQTSYPGQTGYQIGFMLAPGERKEFEFHLQPTSSADLIGDIQVVSGEASVSSGVRMVFGDALALYTATVASTNTPTLTPTTMPTITPTPVIIPFQAVVQIKVDGKMWGRWKADWTGSGSIITPDGLILTNAHVVDSTNRATVTQVIVAITKQPDMPPVDSYYAEVLSADQDLDIAVIRITKDMKGASVDYANLNLPTVTLGDSDSLQLGDAITILGYPGIGGDTITLTRGEVGGFTPEKKYGERAYIKTAASITGGTSGGLAMDQYGLMIAIPTQMGNGNSDEVIDCRVIADTNGDGEINERDDCVPAGGFINALRPINLALPLIEQARRIAGGTLPPVTVNP